MMWLIHFIQMRISLKVCSLCLLHASGIDLSVFTGNLVFVSPGVKHRGNQNAKTFPSESNAVEGIKPSST